MFLFISLICCILVFTGDLFIPRGYVEWLLYIIPLLIIYRAQNIIWNGILLGIIAVLMAIGFFLSPDPGIPAIISAVDRVEGMIAFIAFSFVINSLIVSRKMLLVANEQIAKKAEELASANKELEAFSYSASHDLRSPLRTIKGFTEILKEDYSETLDETVQDYIDRIATSAARMEVLIEDLLNLSKIARYEVASENIDISNIASSILTELAHANPQRKVLWHVQDDLRDQGDSRLITIALSNLLGNAWKYTSKKDKAEIDVGAKKQENHIIYYVRDNGVGFDMKQANSVFVPFRRLHAESEFTGTGIGLAIVERVIKRHNGSIWCESEIGKGATFYFTIGWCPK